ncbi:MAG: peptidoglycan bridge formation glycyltransferase FemA/FemB family protein [Clostridia bacterium]|nr:peptidoglycan bridge formation glycyltransferase FemA/FemB family protein [Clostridia bacterium]
MQDIYFAEEYGRLYEKCESGKAIRYVYDSEFGRVSHLFIKREIPIKADKELYDITTPYGYGGPIIERVCDGHTREELISGFEANFSEYCKSEGIVSEFVRFHPIFNNASDFKDVYSAIPIRKTLGTDLTLEDPVSEEFSKGCRKNIRRSTAKGVTWRVTEAPADISRFKDIYYSTMDRNGASDYYYFDDEYFNDCLKYFQKNLIFVEAIFEEKTIAAGLYFVYNNTIHIHLSGTLSEYLHLSPAYILRYAVTLWGKEHGYKLIHHGGGRSNAEDDNLYLFKKQFAQMTEFDFYVGKRIWDNAAYDMLCRESGNTECSDFFPAYRKPRI